jgi:hypothetical protein
MAETILSYLLAELESNPQGFRKKMGGLGSKPYDMEPDIETTIALAKTHDPLPQAASSGDLTRTLTQGFR